MVLKKNFYFYDNDVLNIKINFPVNQFILKSLYSKMDSIPILAWEKFRKNIIEYNERVKIFEEGENIDSIEISESSKITNFTPKLWYIVSMDSGFIKGLNRYCVVVGYNTPLKDENDFNKRCLAIYEKKDEKYFLIKQSFNALENFGDYKNDLLFNGWDETNFSIRIDNGNIVIAYQYMRGRAEYVFSYENKNWVLTYFESTHTTCCQVEFLSYDYKTKKYHYSVSSINEDKSEGDTTINITLERPIIYMDSTDFSKFYFNETGILIK